MNTFPVCNYTACVRLLSCIYVDRLDSGKGSRILCVGVSGGKRAPWHQCSSRGETAAALFGERSGVTMISQAKLCAFFFLSVSDHHGMFFTLKGQFSQTCFDFLPSVEHKRRC